MDTYQTALLYALNEARAAKGLVPMGIEPAHQHDGVRHFFANGNGKVLPNVIDPGKPYWEGGWHVSQNRFLNVLEFCREFIDAPAPAKYGDSICQAMMVRVLRPQTKEDPVAWARSVIKQATRNTNGCFYARLMDARCAKPTNDPTDPHIIDGRQFRRVAIWLFQAGKSEWAIHIRLFPEKTLSTDAANAAE